MHKSIYFLVFIIVVCLVVVAEPALAGPGGKIAKAMYQTFWGKVVLFGLVVFFMPLIIYTLIKEKIAERRARKDLRYMTQFSALFEWLKIKERVTDCFYRVHAAWSKEDVSQAADWMTDWYWQNQQVVHLDRWEREGLINICEVKRINNIKPLLFAHRNDGGSHEDSMLVMSITAHMKDYLQDRSNGKVVEGSKTWQDVETIWTFTLRNGKWVVSNIEEDTMSMVYAKMVADLPNIEDTLDSKASA